MAKSVITDRFITKSDDGRRFEIIEYTEYLSAGTFGDPNATVPGAKRLQTSDGLHVNFVSPGIYQIVELGLTVRKS